MLFVCCLCLNACTRAFSRQETVALIFFGGFFEFEFINHIVFVGPGGVL